MQPKKFVKHSEALVNSQTSAVPKACANGQVGECTDKQAGKTMNRQVYWKTAIEAVT